MYNAPRKEATIYPDLHAANQTFITDKEIEFEKIIRTSKIL
jgi:hypothetical protein